MLANAVGQLHMYRLTPCIREQARSHIFNLHSARTQHLLMICYSNRNDSALGLIDTPHFHS